MSIQDDIAALANGELVAIFDESGLPVALEPADKEQLASLYNELAEAIKAGRYPESTLHKIKKIYSRKDEKE